MLNMLVNFFTGQMKPPVKGKKPTAYHEFQFEEVPLSALEIIGFKIWYDAMHSDLSPVEKPETYQLHVTAFRLSSRYDNALKRAEVKLREMLAPPAPPESAEPKPMPPEQAAMMEQFEVLFAQTLEGFRNQGRNP